jgi:hypothetical protein
VDGKVVLWAPPGHRRDDVAKALGRPAYTLAGYAIEASVPDGFKRGDHEIRVYALDRDGRTNELRLRDGAKAP